MNDKVYSSLTELCVDICKRNGKTKLIWLGDKTKTLAYEPKADEMLITVHRWFANKSCPGDWLYSRLGDLAAEVTKQLNGEVKTITVGSTVKVNKGAKTFDGKSLMPFVYERNHQVKSISGDRVVITYNGTVVAAVNKSDLTVI
jgi:hypothetical protein